MGSKMIAEHDQEQSVFEEVMARLDYSTERIVEFFNGFLDAPCKDAQERIYKSIAKKMLPLDA